MGDVATYFMIGSGLVLAAVAAAALADRLGAPFLLVFLALGMLAGPEGPGGLTLTDLDGPVAFGALALALILFDGGARTTKKVLLQAGRPGALLASAGVLMTVAITALAAHQFLGLGLVESILVGAITASTDAAAVFSLIGGQGLKVRPKVAATLETESGFNDPIAVALTLICIETLLTGFPGWGSLAVSLIWQFAGGAVIGVGGGMAIALGLRSKGLPGGLQPILAAAGGVFVFAFAQGVGASGFLAIYVAGLTYAMTGGARTETNAQFLDGLAWLSQIGLFLMLGLIVTPSHLVAVALPAMAIAVCLILVARPVAVALCLAPLGFTRREIGFASWMGLRGATPIFLGLLPVVAGVENANLYFSVAFAVTLASLVIQGWSAPQAARLFGMADKEAAPAGWLSAAPALFAAMAAIVATGIVSFRVPDLPPDVVQTVELAPQSRIELAAAFAEGPVVIEQLPPDWPSSSPDETDRVLFLKIAQSAVEAANRRIASERAAILRWMAIEAAGGEMSVYQQAERDRIARRYGGRYRDLEALLVKVDQMPVDLVIAQAALATGWGTSSAARERNDLFARRPGARFETLALSADDLLLYLNSHPAFDDLRAERARLRNAGEPVSGKALLDLIGRYAGDGPSYLAQLRAIRASGAFLVWQAEREPGEIGQD